MRYGLQNTNDGPIVVAIETTLREDVLDKQKKGGT